MIPLYQLENKLNYQVKNFELILKIPDTDSARLWAYAIYNSVSFSEVLESLRETYKPSNLDSILQHESLKYLLINEYDDQEIVKSLRQEIAPMAARIERSMPVKTGTLEIISAIYNVLGLSDDANFIVNTGSSFRLDWQPYICSLTNPLQIQYSDLYVHSVCYRLIATKFPFEKLSLNNIRTYLYIVHSENEELFNRNKSVRNTFYIHLDWFLNTFSHINSEQTHYSNLTPTPFKIEGVRYLVYGFPLMPFVVSEHHKPNLEIQLNNLEGDQKFIVRIDQQTLVFFGRRIDDKISNIIDYKKYVSVYRAGILSHVEADDRLIEIERVNYLTCFRPYCLEDNS